MKLQIFVLALVAIQLLRSIGFTNAAESAQKAEPQNQIFALEGTLKIHPKFLFKHYITGFGDGQECALFGEDKLRNIKVGSRIHVEGRLGTRFHPGGTEQNPSPFPRTYFICMELESVKVLREPEQ